MTLTNNSEYVTPFAATQKGKTSFKLGSSTSTTYAMTMTFAVSNALEFNEKMAIRAYSKLSDGRVYYSDIVRFSICEVAEKLYYNLEMPTIEGHNYLYNKIIKIAKPDAVEKMY